ncbi:hypothetical protein F2Q69_00029810 [Brassica cretica]|uniref:Uncharacterized protein n=1 Tax=Brassica cretica TaxID=69181 RepID=A0A8S9SCZ1_BRACR|nr:hypothetical protein F2Q69_00029810 [Brassica cretica]
MHGLMSFRRFGRARSLRSDRTLVRAWSLRSDRALARDRSLRSDRAFNGLKDARILAKRQILGSRIKVFDTMPRDVRDQCAGFRARPSAIILVVVISNKLNGKKYRFESSRRICFEKMLVRKTVWSSKKVFISRKEISSKNESSGVCDVS